MSILDFEVFKLRIQYFEPIAVTDKNGTREGQYLGAHHKELNTFEFLNAETQKKEVLNIEDVEIRIL